MDMSYTRSLQTADLGITRSSLEHYLMRSGYWGTDALRTRNQYTLSPSVYVADPQQKTDLERLAKATYAAVVGLNTELCRLAKGSQHPNHTQALLLKLANVSSRGLYRPIDQELKVPPVLKIDLVQDGDGRYFIAEVDSYNPRGFGYVALLEESLLPAVFPRFPGLAMLSSIVVTHGVSQQEPLCIVVSEYERYYETAFSIFSNALACRGIECVLVREKELQDSPLPQQVLIIPDTMDYTPKIRDRLVQNYREGRLRAMYPPVAYLGSKAFLPHLRTFPGMEEFIPPTFLLGKRLGRQAIPWLDDSVLKASVSSGMKKVFFSDLDAGEYTETLAYAMSRKSPSWIVQKQVPQIPTPVTVFDNEGNRLIADYYLRITAYISAYGIVDVEVTGRPDRKVHGAPDCIQIPVITAS